MVFIEVRVVCHEQSLSSCPTLSILSVVEPNNNGVLILSESEKKERNL